jgi:hypothetical protein
MQLNCIYVSNAIAALDKSWVEKVNILKFINMQGCQSLHITVFQYEINCMLSSQLFVKCGFAVVNI